jgi:N-acetylmuramoyl-L-alanine amidase
VHTNSFTDPEANGVLTFYGKRTAAEDIRLAQALHNVMAPALHQGAPLPAEFIDYGVRRFGAGVLRRSTMPAALLEPSFMSNPAEARLLATAIYTAPGPGVLTSGCRAATCRRGQIAQAAYEGILAYFAGTSRTA